MLHIKSKLNALWNKLLPLLKAGMATARKGAKQIKPLAKRIVRILLRHRVATTAIASCLTLTMLMSVMTVSIHKVNVLVDGEEILSYHTVFTDDESVLKKADLTLKEGDELARSEDGGVITLSIARSFPIYIEADNATVMVLLAKGTVADALQKAGLTCGGEDQMNYAPADALVSGMKIKLDRVTTEQVVVTKSIDYDTKEVYTDSLYVGNREVAQKGKDGEKECTYSVTYINGKETERKLLGEKVTKEPVEKIVRVGTKTKDNFKPSSSAPASYKKVMTMNCTAYSAGGSTATGRPAQWGVIAVDPKVIPLGTRVYVESVDGKFIYGNAIAADTGGAIKGNIIDICVNTRKEAYAFGRRPVRVYILG